jgi:Polysaccharide deacetylase
MLAQLRRASFRVLKGTGTFRLVRDSRWRDRRLLILCYHGISLEDEHEWSPCLYMQPGLLEKRLTLLKRGGYNVLPLGDALRRMYEVDLPPRSVALTFDDGTYDFYREAFPLLKSFGYPVTVYQSTYYTQYSRPVFNLICSYMLWKFRGLLSHKGQELGLPALIDLRTEAGRTAAHQALISKSEEKKMTGEQKDELAGRLAKLLGIDYEELRAKRILQLMNAEEIRQLAAEGVDFQLHTHRHRTFRNPISFHKEIRENRERLHQITGLVASHFCYPSGVHHKDFLPWLEEENVSSATTCEPGIAAPCSHKLLLPRFVDTSVCASGEFEAWLTGLGHAMRCARSTIVSLAQPRSQRNPSQENANFLQPAEPAA